MGATGPRRVPTIKIFAASSLLAIVIAVPAIAATLVTHYVLKTNLIITGTAGIITLFVAMAFGYKLSKRLAKVQGNNSDLEKT